MAPIDWKSLQERLEAEAVRLSAELKKEADRLAAQAQDPAVQARLREELRGAGQQALQALAEDPSEEAPVVQLRARLAVQRLAGVAGMAGPEASHG